MFGCVNKLAEIFFFHFTALLFININLLLAQASLVSWIIVRDWQIFGHGSDFPTWSEVGTKSRAKVPNFKGNFEPSYLWTGKSFCQNSKD